MSHNQEATMIAPFKKVVRLGTTPIGGRMASVYIKITWDDKQELSISGVEGPLPSGNALGSSGQIDMHKPQIVKYAPGWTAATVSKLWQVWNDWHLNGMMAGCEHQQELGWQQDDYDKHPSEPCPVCGYKYGTEWKRKEVPEEVLTWLHALPDTDKTPSWV